MRAAQTAWPGRLCAVGHELHLYCHRPRADRADHKNYHAGSQRCQNHSAMLRGLSTRGMERVPVGVHVLWTSLHAARAELKAEKSPPPNMPPPAVLNVPVNGNRELSLAGYDLDLYYRITLTVWEPVTSQDSLSIVIRLCFNSSMERRRLRLVHNQAAGLRRPLACASPSSAPFS
jgi:hypothetical protein